MTVHLHRKISVLMTLVGMACMAMSFSAAQQSAFSQAGSDDASDTGQNISRGSSTSHPSASVPRTAAQWTAGAKGFGTANDKSWGNKTTGLQPNNGAMWTPGTERFGVSVQPGGRWQTSGASLAGANQTTSQNALEELNQSEARNLSQGIEKLSTGNVSYSLNQSASESQAHSTSMNARQGMNELTTGNLLSTSSSSRSPSNNGAVPAIAHGMNSTFRHSSGPMAKGRGDRTKFRHTLGSGSLHSSSKRSLSRSSLNRHEFSSRSFGMGRRTFRRDHGSALSSGSSKRSFGRGDSSRGDLSQSFDSQSTGTSLRERLGGRNQSSERGRLEDRLRKGEFGDVKHATGKISDSDHGLATDIRH